MELSSGSGDSSTRFLKFLLSYPEISCYMPLRSIPCFLETKKTFYHKCILNDQEYLKEISKPVYEGGPYGFDLPSVHRIKRVFPPKLQTVKERDSMQNIFENNEIENIVFPAILEKKDNICENSDDTLKHSYCLLYRKELDEAIILDDLYLANHSKFAYKWIAKNESAGKKAAPFALQMFVKPYLGSWIGETDMSFYVPMPTEALFTKMFNELNKLEGIEKTLRNVYRGYIVLYTDYLIENPEIPHKYIERELGRILRKNPNLIIEAINRLDKHNESFLRSHKATLIKNGRLINLETRREARIKSSSSNTSNTGDTSNTSNRNNINRNKVKVIPLHNVRNTESIETINKSTNEILEFLEYKHMNSRVLRASWDINEFPDIIYNENFEKNAEKALKNKNIDFICIYLSLVPTSYEENEDSMKHANVIIYDKRNNIIERFEPNTRSYLENNPEYEDVLNDAIMRIPFIANRNPKLIETVDICPISPHAEEGKEYKELFQYHGGSCAIWTAWYIDLRLSNPNKDPSDILKYAIKYIQNIGSFKVFINAYRAYLKRGVGMINNANNSNTNNKSRKISIKSAPVIRKITKTKSNSSNDSNNSISIKNNKVNKTV